jgi:hypothetical protein
VAVLVWLMIIPMLLKIDLAALETVGAHWKGIAATVDVTPARPSVGTRFAMRRTYSRRLCSE